MYINMKVADIPPPFCLMLNINFVKTEEFIQMQWFTAKKTHLFHRQCEQNDFKNSQLQNDLKSQQKINT